MPSLFKPTYTKLDTVTGTRLKRRARKWYGSYTDADGQLRRVPLCTDKAAAHSMLNNLIRQAERKQAGLVEPAAEQAKRPLGEHVEDYRSHLTAKGDSSEHVALTISRIQAVVGGCQMRALGDLSALSVTQWLADARSGGSIDNLSDEITGVAATYRQIAEVFGVTESAVRHWRRQGAPIKPKKQNDLGAIDQWRRRNQIDKAGISKKTSNHYLRAMKSFAIWLCREGRLVTNPLAHLSAINAESDVRRARRPLSPAEFDHLIEQTIESGTEYRGLCGIERAFLYLTACQTGLRANELASLTVSNLDLDAQPPTITVEAAYSKRRRKDVQPVRSDLAALLKAWIVRSGKDASAKLWPGTWSDDAADVLRRDLKPASID